MEIITTEYLERLRDAGVISTEEYREACDRLTGRPARAPRRRWLFRVLIWLAVAVLAGMLVILDASLPMWITTGVIIVVIALLMPLATGKS